MPHPAPEIVSLRSRLAWAVTAVASLTGLGLYSYSFRPVVRLHELLIEPATQEGRTVTLHLAIVGVGTDGLRMRDPVSDAEIVAPRTVSADDTPVTEDDLGRPVSVRGRFRARPAPWLEAEALYVSRDRGWKVGVSLAACGWVLLACLRHFRFSRTAWAWEERCPIS